MHMQLLLSYAQAPYGDSMVTNSAKFTLIGMLRGESCVIRISKLDISNPEYGKAIGDEYSRDTVGAMIQLVARTWPNLVYQYPPLANWWESFIHRLIIAFDILSGSYKEVLEREPIDGEYKLRTLVVYTWVTVLNMLRDVVSKTHPEEAETLRKYIKDHLLKAMAEDLEPYL